MFLHVFVLSLDIAWTLTRCACLLFKSYNFRDSNCNCTSRVESEKEYNLSLDLNQQLALGCLHPSKSMCLLRVGLHLLVHPATGSSVHRCIRDGAWRIGSENGAGAKCTMKKVKERSRGSCAAKTMWAAREMLLYFADILMCCNRSMISYRLFKLLHRDVIDVL